MLLIHKPRTVGVISVRFYIGDPSWSIPSVYALLRKLFNEMKIKRIGKQTHQRYVIS
jgi:hypothetical protein